MASEVGGSELVAVLVSHYDSPSLNKLLGRAGREKERGKVEASALQTTTRGRGSAVRILVLTLLQHHITAICLFSPHRIYLPYHSHPVHIIIPPYAAARPRDTCRQTNPLPPSSTAGCVLLHISTPLALTRLGRANKRRVHIRDRQTCHSLSHC